MDLQKQLLVLVFLLALAIAIISSEKAPATEFRFPEEREAGRTYNDYARHRTLLDTIRYLAQEVDGSRASPFWQELRQKMPVVASRSSSFGSRIKPGETAENLMGFKGMRYGR